MLSRAIALIALLSTGLTSGSALAADCWTAPVTGVVVDAFRPPPCPYCAGNRGLEYAVGVDTPVRAVAGGTVTWAGSIAGVRWVVVRHADARRATYGRMTTSFPKSGERVARGAVIGRATGDFYFGLRIGEMYVDPAPFMGRLVGRPRLVPIDGSAPRPAPAPLLRCGV